MNRIAMIGSIAAGSMIMSFPLFAADALPWPWKGNAPVDPALSVLNKVEKVTATIGQSEPPILMIEVAAMAPQTGFTDLQLTPRKGDPNDRIFEFDARGRAPQVGEDTETPVSISASYKDAPIGKFDIIEVYSKSNCMAFSVKDNKPAECAQKP
jgi:hypothetical protein